MSEPFVTFENALLMLGLDVDDVTNNDSQLIQFLIDQTTAVILAYCNRDPRLVDPDYPDDPADDCSSLAWVASRLVQSWYATAANLTAGIAEQEIGTVKIKYAQDTTGLDPLSKMLLGRYRKITIA